MRNFEVRVAENSKYPDTNTTWLRPKNMRRDNVTPMPETDVKALQEELFRKIVADIFSPSENARQPKVMPSPKRVDRDVRAIIGDTRETAEKFKAIKNSFSRHSHQVAEATMRGVSGKLSAPILTSSQHEALKRKGNFLLLDDVRRNHAEIKEASFKRAREQKENKSV